MNLAEVVSDHARTRPDALALVDGEREVRYRDLDRLIRRGAAQLRSLDIGAGDAVAICLGDNADHVIAFLSVARLGAVSVPIDWRAPPEERTRIAQGFRAKLALVEADAEAISAVPSRTVGDRWYREAHRQDIDQEFPSDADAPLMIGLTSGTTGAVKGMLVTHAQMHARTRPFDGMLGGGPHRYLSTSPLAFSAGRNYCLTHVVKGNTVIFHPSLFSPDEFVETVNRTRATAAFSVPTVIRRLLDLPKGMGPLLPRIEMLMCGGAPLTAEEKRAAVKHVTPNFYEFYGTVATGPISFLRPSEIAEHAASAGRVSPLWDLAVVDDLDRPVEPGASGRLRVRGPALASAPIQSVGNPEGFRNGWYYTGDLAALDKDGFLLLKGRANDVILHGGSNVYPDEVEAVLMEHEAVAEAAVVGRPSREMGEDVVAFVVPRRVVRPESLAGHCSKSLTRFKVPSEIILVTSLPKTSFGKIDRKRLRSGPTT